MRVSPSQLFLLISLVLLFGKIDPAGAQELYPVDDGQTVWSAVVIDFGRAYISGIGILKKDGQSVYGSIFNEFGITALSFRYDENKDKVELLETMDMLRRGPLKHILRKDLSCLMTNLKLGTNIFKNEKRGIEYKLSPLENTSDEIEG